MIRAAQSTTVRSSSIGRNAGNNFSRTTPSILQSIRLQYRIFHIVRQSTGNRICVHCAGAFSFPDRQKFIKINAGGQFNNTIHTPNADLPQIRTQVVSY